jgi:hypothetical protein
MPRRVVNRFAYHNMPGGRSQLEKVWKMTLPCLMWCIWRERNNRRFEDHERTLVESKALLFKTLFLWAAASDFNFLNFNVFLNLFSAFTYVSTLLHTPCVLGLSLYSF